MNKFIKFISGKEYFLKDFFSGDTKIVIPDLQRDYCWGDNAYTGKDNNPQELVSGFLKNIIELFETDEESSVTLGLVYGYEQPCNHIQICDGQQRLTTLFLLLGVLNMKCKEHKVFDNYIISEQEMKDDYEPHLLYAIRESTLYFLSDLSLHLFINRELDVNEIKKSNWYFCEYDQDASIQSMISAVKIISRILDSYNEINYQKLGNYVLNKLRVLYYDMGNRSRGEETYVVINTTGEPLSATENIKPILLGNPSLSEEQRRKYSDQWEEREEWFWQHRGIDKTSDNGMYIFLTWYWQIGLQQEYQWEDDKKIPLNINDLFLSVPNKIKDNANETKLSIKNYEKFKSLDNLDNYFNALKSLVNVITIDKQIQKILYTLGLKEDDCHNETGVWTWMRSNDLDIVLPLLGFINKYGNSLNILYQFVRRIRKNHFDNKWSKNDENQPSRKAANFVDWRYIIQMINQCDVSDILSADIGKLNISRIPNIPINRWYAEEEIWKDKHSSDITSLYEMEDHPLLMGDLFVLRKCCNDTEFDLPAITKRWNNLQRIYNAFNASKAKEDRELSNWFRLYCVVTETTPITHISYCSSDFEGCFFSSRRETPWWIESHNIDKLLSSSNLLNDVKKIIKEIVGNYIKHPQTHKELIKSWLTLKAIKASKDGILLNHWNKRAVSAYLNMGHNYINKQCSEFHWGNILCGYSWRKGVYYAGQEDWNNCTNLNSPITSLPFNHYKNKRIENDEIKVYDEEIMSLIDSFLGIENSTR